jgi:hypothetical protein
VQANVWRRQRQQQMKEVLGAQLAPHQFAVLQTSAFNGLAVLTGHPAPAAQALDNTFVFLLIGLCNP